MDVGGVRWLIGDAAESEVRESKENSMQEARIATLGQRHAKLDSHIAAEARRPGSDDLSLTEMKRQRLSLKDQLASVRN